MLLTQLRKVITATGGIPPYNFLWDDPLAQTTATATGLAVGNYVVQVTDSLDCVNLITVTIPQLTGLNEFENQNSNFTVYPNPNNGQFVVKFGNEIKEETLIEVRNIIGMLIYTNQVDNISTGYTKKIDLSGHNKGVYFLRISNSSGTRVEKLIVY